MSVILNPTKYLEYKRPFSRSRECILSVTNPHHQPVFLKVKTTAPKIFFVRPNRYTIEAGCTAEVKVTHVALEVEPPAGERCKHKLLVETILVPMKKKKSALRGLVNWPHKEEAPDPIPEIHKQKLKVRYLPLVEPPKSKVVDTEQTRALEGETSSIISNLDRESEMPPAYSYVVPVQTESGLFSLQAGSSIESSHDANPANLELRRQLEAQKAEIDQLHAQVEALSSAFHRTNLEAATSVLDSI